MPYLNLKTVKGLLSAEQKQYLMTQFTDLLVQTEGGGNPDFRKLVWIHIQEEAPEHWQLGELKPTQAFIDGFVTQREANRVK
jgi:4-oxalocrotonate tautomerase